MYSLSRLTGMAVLPGLLLPLIAAAACASPDTTAPAVSSTMTSGAIWLPNQWTLRPAGTSLPLGDFPARMAMSPDGRRAAVVHAGFHDEEVRMIDLAEKREESRHRIHRTSHGVAFAPDGKTLYISGGTSNRLVALPVSGGKLDKPTSVSLVNRASSTSLEYPAGIAVSRDGRTAYVAMQYANRLQAVPLDASGMPNPYPDAHGTTVTRFAGKIDYPFAVVLHPSKPVAYVSLWGGAAVAEVALPGGAVTLIRTDSHPNEMVLSRDGARLFVACANTNNVNVIDTQRRVVTERLNCAMFPNMPAGSTPNALALSQDQHTLAVANADNNNLALFDVTNPGAAASLGFIPTGWYPTCVTFTPDGGLAVVNGKGNGSLANPEGPDLTTSTLSKQYIGGLLPGSISFIAKPDAKAMADYTRQAYQCTPLRSDLQPVARAVDNPIPSRVGDPSPIKYCVYIVKENRTYDQVLGDVPEGNGDPALCLFNRQVSPNHHALASEFVLMDNFFVEAEVSADGHAWSMGAYATDYVERTWPPSYGGQSALPYPSEGNPMGRPDKGNIWDQAKAAGVSYRSYGEYVDGAGKNGKGRTRDKALKGHFDPSYPGFDLGISDLDRSKRFIEELGRFERGGDLPRLTIIRLPNDHTNGTARKSRTPRAYVAQNDLALGQILEALSRSRFWKQMAVFILEDDAQNGPDHVDAHRSIAFLAGPYVKRNAVVHRMYSTSSVLRTIELILGLQPMSQFDAGALPMYECFTAKPDERPYAGKPATWNVNEMNADGAPRQKESAMLDMRREDANPDVLFNEIIWQSVHGPDSKMPSPVRAAFVRTAGESKDED